MEPTIGLRAWSRESARSCTVGAYSGAVRLRRVLGATLKKLLPAALLLQLAACTESVATPPALPVTPSAPHGPAGPLCAGLIDRFIGLPADESISPPATGALAGRWWVRGCSVKSDGGRVSLHLSGPGWYWVNRVVDGIRLRQELPLKLDVMLSGTFAFGMKQSVGTLWFRPDADPDVVVEVTGELELHGDTVWGSLLRRVPLLPVESQARERVAEEGSAELRARLREGFTVTYDVLGGQADASLGLLPVGETPRHPFDDGTPWQANERQLLYPGGGHVMGPLEPGDHIPIDIRVEHGGGLSYHAVCADDLPSARPRLGERFAAEGQVDSPGEHHFELSVDGCPWYLVTTPLGADIAVVSLRVRQPRG